MQSNLTYHIKKYNKYANQYNSGNQTKRIQRLMLKHLTIIKQLKASENGSTKGK